MLKNFKIYTKMLEVTLWLFPKVTGFPKKQRFVLGQQIENSALRCLRLIIEANNASGPALTRGRLDELNTELEVLRSLLRIAYELRFISGKSLAFITAQVDEVGKMRGGWAKRYPPAVPAPVTAQAAPTTAAAAPAAVPAAPVPPSPG